MKTQHLIITVIFLGITPFLITFQAYGIPPIEPQVEYVNSDTIVIGKVISVVPYSPTQMKYQIQVEQYLKNPQNQNIVTVIADGTNKTLVEQGMAPDTVYDVGQRAMLYLKNDDGIYSAWYFSHSTDSLCDPAPTKEDMNFSLSQDARFSALPAYSPLRVETGIPNLIRVDDTAVMYYDAWNRHFTTKTFDVEFEVKNQTSGELLYNVTKQVELKPCIGHQTVNATFIPQKAGTYEIDAIFDNSLLGTTVEVRHNFSDVKLEKGPFLFPLQQYRSGISANQISCREDLMLITKASDGSPACVKPLTYNKLALQGWAKLLDSTTTTYVTVNGTTYDIPYTIRGYGNKMLYIESDSSMKYLVAHVESTAEKGELTMTIPKTLLDPKIYGQSEFTVLVDGIETKYTETLTDDTDTLTIPFGFGAKEIEVLAIGVGMQTSSEKNGTLSGTVSAFVYGGPLGSSQNHSVHYEIDVYSSDGITIVGKTFSDSNAKYSLQLPSGNYIIYTYNGTKQTHLVSVYPEQNTVFDISSSLVVP